MKVKRKQKIYGIWKKQKTTRRKHNPPIKKDIVKLSIKFLMNKNSIKESPKRSPMLYIELNDHR